MKCKSGLSRLLWQDGEMWNGLCDVKWGKVRGFLGMGNRCEKYEKMRKKCE